MNQMFEEVKDVNPEIPGVAVNLKIPKLDSSEINALLADGTLKMKGGKSYLQVAQRVLAFRAMNPDHTIHTGVVSVPGTERTYVKAEIAAPPPAANAPGHVLATAYKEIKFEGGKNAAKDYPLETAETGAIGRALALCGFGTLMGDLDEGDQISDSPVVKGR